MNSKKQLCVRLVHCGNRNIANPKDTLEKNAFYLPMGLFPLASILKRNGVDVEIISLDLVTSDRIEKILNFETLDAVGLDCHWVNQSLAVIDTVKLIKNTNPDVFVFLGGYTASFFAKEIMSGYPSIDAIVRGDGEVPIVELCNVLYNNALDANCRSVAFRDVPNLVWRKNDGELVFNELSYVATAADMEYLEFAEVNLLRNWDWYRDMCRFWTRFTPLNSFPLFFLEVGRGCPYACSFCGGNVEAQGQISNRNASVFRSADSVIRTIKTAVSCGFSLFYLCLESEKSDEWYVDLLRRIREQKLNIALAYGCWRIPSRTLVDALSESCSWAVIEISPETSVLELRRRNKDRRLFYTNAELEQCLEYIDTKNNVRAHLYFRYYLPFDTEETIFTTLDYITRLFLKYSRFVEFEYDNSSIEPCSLLYLYPEKYQVDIKVHCFGDYLASLEEYHLLKKDHLPDAILLKPRSISEEEIDRINKKIQLFKHFIAYFPNSVTMLLEKCGTVSVISDYLREADLSNFGLADAQGILLRMCEKYAILDPELIESITVEAKAVPSSRNYFSRI